MAEQESNRSRGWVWGIVVIAVLIAAFFIIRSLTLTTTQVRTAQVSFQNLVSTVSTNGKVEPENDFQAHAPMPGVVEQLLVGVDEKVVRGQELIRMDVSDARSKVVAAQAALDSATAALLNMQRGGTQDENLSANADLAAAQTQETQAKSSLSTLQALQAKGAASANEVQSAQQHLNDIQSRIAQLKTRRTGRYSAADLAAQRSQVEQARSSLQAAKSAYANVDIRAPFSGTVYSIPITQYDYVGGGEALLNLADLNHIQVRAYFDEPEIGKLAVGQPVKIVWDAKPQQAWHGHITQAPTTVINYGTRNVGECMISVDDSNGELLPNTNVTVTVTTLQHMHVLSIPREGLHTDGMMNYVYKIVDERLHRTPVQVGVVNLTNAEITGGISEGDTVVLGATNEADLRDGLQVKARQAH